MSKIEELLVEHSIRPTNNTIVEIGEVWERFYNSQTGILFRALINARIKEQISNHADTQTTAERRLGRAEGMQIIQDDIELAIAQMNSLKQPLNEGENNA